MSDILDTYLFSHWMFFAGYIGFIVIGQFMKVQVWTKDKAASSKVFHWFRRTLSMHAPIAGLCIGALPGMPVSPFVDGLFGAMLYWFFVGILSSFTYHAASEYVHNRWGIDLEKAVDRAVSPSMRADDDTDDGSIPK